MCAVVTHLIQGEGREFGGYPPNFTVVNIANLSPASFASACRCVVSVENLL